MSVLGHYSIMRNLPVTATQLISTYLEQQGQAFLRSSHKRRSFCRGLERHIESNGCYRKIVEAVATDLVHAFNEFTDVTTDGVRRRAPVELLHIAAHVCERYECDVDSLVREIVRLIVKHSSDGSSWFDFLSPFGSIDDMPLNTLYPFKAVRKQRNGYYTNEWITKPHLKAMAYYLKHGSKVYSSKSSLLGLEIPKLSFVDQPIKHRYFGYITPLTLACLAGHPDAVLVLLRHGAAPLFPPAFKVVGGRVLGSPWGHPLHALINQLNLRGGDGIVEDLNIDEDTPPRQNGCHILRIPMMRQKKLILCLLYMFRVLQAAPIVFADQVDHFARTTNSARKVVILRGYAPWVEEHISAPKLQHVCRCSIRRSLQEAGSLPGGIDELPLPNRLKKYIDLEY